MYQRHPQHTLFITLSGGTPHKPNPLDADRFPVFEAAAASAQLIKMGVPPDIIWEENFSLDTIGNAYFLRAVHTDYIKRIKKIVVVTNKWHMERAKAIFRHIYGLPKQYRKTFVSRLLPFLVPHRPLLKKLEFADVEDALPPQALASRVKKEREALIVFEEKTKKEFRSMAELHHWMFTSHGAYSASRHSRPRIKVDPSLLKSY